MSILKQVKYATLTTAMPTLAANPTAKFHYEILDEFEAGIVLSGAEVKSAKLGRVNLKGSYVSVHEGRLTLINAHIAPYEKAKGNQSGYQPTRPRTLLVHKRELSSFIGKSTVQGLTFVPLSVYTRGGFIKVKVGIGRGKKKSDKREAIKKRDTDRRLRQAVKLRNR